MKLIDFGFAMEANLLLGKDAIEAGTLLYAPPEQTGLLNRAVDARSDLYALGGVLYHCLTGKPAFESPTALGLLDLHLKEKPMSPSVVNPGVRPVVSALILEVVEGYRTLMTATRAQRDFFPTLRTSRKLVSAVRLSFSAGTTQKCRRLRCR